MQRAGRPGRRAAGARRTRSLADAGVGRRVHRHATPASASTTEQQRRIFEAFAQGDGTTGPPVRRHGPRPVDQPRAGRAARRRDHARAARPARAARSPSTSRRPPAPRRPPTAAGGARRCTVADARARRRPRAEPTAHPPGAGLAGMKVLVVDDDFRNIFALTALLERGDARGRLAESGAEGVAILERDARHRHRADGHHDAGDGRLRDDPGDARADAGATTSRSSPSPARWRPASASAASTPAPPTTSPSRSTPPSLLLVLGEWLPSDLPAGEPPAVIG